MRYHRAQGNVFLRCPFSLARMVTLTRDGKVLYRAAHPNCLPFPLSGDTTLMAGIPRNFEVYDPLDFLAEVTCLRPALRQPEPWGRRFRLARLSTTSSSTRTAYDKFLFFQCLNPKP